VAYKTDIQVHQKVALELSGFALGADAAVGLRLVLAAENPRKINHLRTFIQRSDRSHPAHVRISGQTL
jgi:hypothetical protein